MTKPLHSSFVTIVEGSAKGFKPQFFACLHGQSLSNTRIELYKSEEQAKSQQPSTRCIVIKPNSTISVNKEKHSFVISNSTLVTQSDADLKQWLTKIYQAQPTVKGLSDYSLQIYDEVTDPKNDLGPFMATLQQTECLSFYGPCQLEIQPRPSERAYFVAVYDMNQPPRLVIRWQIDHLRGYGSNESVIKIQTGRRTPTGVSTFIFQTSEGHRIHQAIHYWAEIITNKGNPSAVPDLTAQNKDLKMPIPVNKLPPKPTGPGMLPPRDKKLLKEPVMQASSAYQPLIALKKPVSAPTYEPMRRSPSRTSSIDTTDSPTAHVGGTYEALNVNGNDAKQPMYQPLTRESSSSGPQTSVYDDINAKPPAKDPPNLTGYAALGPRDETKASYMKVNHNAN